MSRGQLSEKVQEKAKELLGYEITKEELRLMPYVHFVMMNEKRIGEVETNLAEKVILGKWKKLGYINYKSSEINYSSKVSMTKEFWDALCEILWLSYAGGVE